MPAKTTLACVFLYFSALRFYESRTILFLSLLFGFCPLLLQLCVCSVAELYCAISLNHIFRAKPSIYGCKDILLLFVVLSSHLYSSRENLTFV